MLSVDFGMLLDWRVPAGRKTYMKEALEQVVDLFRAPVSGVLELLDGYHHEALYQVAILRTVV